MDFMSKAAAYARARLPLKKAEGLTLRWPNALGETADEAVCKEVVITIEDQDCTYIVTASEGETVFVRPVRSMPLEPSHWTEES